MKFTEELLRAVAALDLKTRRNIPALLSGETKSPFRGHGMQFKEFRSYEPGDDIRHMSWSVTARTGKATVKVYEEERELNVVVLVDTSGSSSFAFQGKRKLDMYARVTSLIGLAAVHAGDKFGLMLFDEKPGFYLPPARKRDQVRIGLTHLMGREMVGKKSDLASAFRFLQKVLKERALIIVVSDFLVPDFSLELKQAARRNEVLLFHCVDDAERGSRMDGIYEVCDPESGEMWLLDAGSKAVRDEMALSQVKLQEDLGRLTKSSGTEFLTLSVQDDYLQRLVHFFHDRGPSRL